MYESEFLKSGLAEKQFMALTEQEPTMESENPKHAPEVKKPKQTQPKHKIKQMTEMHSFSVKHFPLLQKHLLSLQKEIGNNYLTLTEFMELSRILCEILLQNLTLLNQLFWFSPAGHRVCLGEQMARVELFIFFTNLLRAFTFQLPEGVKEINPEYILGAILQPHPYKLCAIPR